MVKIDKFSVNQQENDAKVLKITIEDCFFTIATYPWKSSSGNIAHITIFDLNDELLQEFRDKLDEAIADNKREEVIKAKGEKQDTEGQLLVNRRSA